MAALQLFIDNSSDNAPVLAIEGDGVSTKKRSLWDLDTELDQIASAFDALEAGGADEDVTAAVERYFGDLIMDRDYKLESYARLIAMRENSAKVRVEQAALYELEAIRLRKLAKSDESRVKDLKRRLNEFFTRKGLTKIETQFFRFSLTKNGGKRPLKFADDASACAAADRFVRVVREWDEDAIRAALAAGETLEFVQLAAQTTRVDIR